MISVKVRHLLLLLLWLLCLQCSVLGNHCDAASQACPHEQMQSHRSFVDMDQWQSYSYSFVKTFSTDDLHAWLSESPFSVTALDFFVSEPDWNAIYYALVDALTGTFHFCRLWLVFFRLLSVPVIQWLYLILEALLPHVMAGLEMALAAFETLDLLYQVVLILSIALITIGIRFGYFRRVREAYKMVRRRIKQRYRAFLASVREKSKVAAALLPHVAFWIGSYIMMSWMPTVVFDFWDNESLWMPLVIWIPLLRSIRAIRQRRLFLHRQQQDAQEKDARENTPMRRRSSRTSNRSASSTESAEEERFFHTYASCLQYWVLWSFACCVWGMVSLFIPAFMLYYVQVPVYWCNLALAWIHSPVTRGDLVLYSVLGPLFNPYANRLQDVSDRRPEANDTQHDRHLAIRALVAFRVLPEKYVHYLSDLWSQGPALAGLMFFFTPGFVTARGCLLVGFGFPAYVTMGALATHRTRNYEWWLLYFVVAVTTEYLIMAVGNALLVSWLPLFYHAKLLWMMWLQFPYFRGAQQLFDRCFGSVFVLPETNKTPDRATRPSLIEVDSLVDL